VTEGGLVLPDEFSSANTYVLEPKKGDEAPGCLRRLRNVLYSTTLTMLSSFVSAEELPIISLTESFSTTNLLVVSSQ